jgi:DNA-binding NtrC family response regulator
MPPPQHRWRWDVCDVCRGRVEAQPTFPLLVVSADDQDHGLLGKILQRDCDLHRAFDRHQAAALIQEHHPWVVICDELLPDGDWRDLLADIRVEPEAPPMIVSSRLADDRLWAEVLNLGEYDLLMKPFIALEVSRIVRMAGYRGRKAGGR